MPNRLIKSNSFGYGETLREVLTSLFVFELFAPSKEIYLLSPWISDFVLIDNSAGQFRALLPEVAGDARLSFVLNLLAGQGTRVHILTRPPQAPTTEFLALLSADVKCREMVRLHEKGLVTDHFYFRGSMNFTFSGVNVNDEHTELTTEPSEIALARLTAIDRWQETK